MTLVSYAQNFEDVMLWRALGHVDGGFYIDVGAAWPDLDSVTRVFYERGWRGVNVEPNPALLDELVAARTRDVNLGVAIADRPGRLSFSVVEGTGLSTLTDEFAGGYRRDGREVRSVEVEVRTLADVVQEFVPEHQEIHFLKVDVEGFEGEVIGGHDWRGRRPWVVVVEATRPTSRDAAIDWEPQLLGVGYVLAYQDGVNRFYVAEEHDELVASFAAPPNVFDGFVTAGQEHAEQRASAFEVEAIQQRHRADVAEEQLRVLEQRVEWMDDRVQRTEQRLESTHRGLVEAHRLVGTLEAGRDEQQRTITQLHLHIERVSNDAAAAVAAVRAESEARAAWIAHLEAHLANVERHISDMHHSTSWRVTRPLRGLRALSSDPAGVARRLLRRPALANPTPPGASATSATSATDITGATGAIGVIGAAAGPTARDTDPDLSAAAAAVRRQIESDLGRGG